MTQPPPTSPPAEPAADASPTESNRGGDAGPTPSPKPPVTLLQPSHRKPSKPQRFLRSFRSAFRSFPILTPTTCRFHSGGLGLHLGGGSGIGGGHHRDGHIHGAARTTGTLFGHRKARITLSVQENPRSVPLLLLEIATPTAKFMQEMGASGLLRIALECEKKAGAPRTPLLEEPLWNAFVNGRSVGYATRREPTEADLAVMQLLHAVSMGAGVLPGDTADAADGEVTYLRAYFDRVTGSRDSETFYMLNPDSNGGPELSIFFVRI